MPPENTHRSDSDAAYPMNAYTYLAIAICAEVIATVS
jgi:hypothetical protein